MATISKAPSNTWKAVIRKRGWLVTIKTFRTKRESTAYAEKHKAKALTLKASLGAYSPAR